MNISNLQISLQESIDSSTTTMEQLFLARAIESANVGQIRAVPTYAQLPSAASNEGLLVFVEADERIYFSNEQAWYNLIDEGKGLLYSWGLNTFGWLGDNTTTNRSSPVSVIGGITDWCQIDSNITFFTSNFLGVRSNGTLWGWGDNSNGQRGDGTTVGRSSPVSVVGGFTDWCQVTGGDNNSHGIRMNGTLWGWGRNDPTQIAGVGDNTTICRSSPVLVDGGFTDWCQVSTGNAFSAAIRRNGTMWVWGSGSDGRLGTNDTINRSSPVLISGDFTDWCQVSAGSLHSLAVRTNGTLWTWGVGTNGRLGTNNTINRSSPVSVVGGFTDWCQASVGSNHSLALRSNGTAWAWGTNSGNGPLGDGTNIPRSSPVSVVGGFTDWCQVAGASAHSLGLRTNGTLWSWGHSCNGQLGNNDSSLGSCKLSPVSVVGGFTDWWQVTAGGDTSFALRKTSFL
jgi:hypothetical protein